MAVRAFRLRPNFTPHGWACPIKVKVVGADADCRVVSHGRRTGDKCLRWLPSADPQFGSNPPASSRVRLPGFSRTISKRKSGKSGRSWCRRGESNPRPRDYETLALPLSYAGTKEPSYAKDHYRIPSSSVRLRYTTPNNLLHPKHRFALSERTTLDGTLVPLP